MREKYFMCHADGCTDVRRGKLPEFAIRYDPKKEEVLLVGSVVFDDVLDKLIQEITRSMRKLVIEETFNSWRHIFRVKDFNVKRWANTKDRLNNTGWMLEPTTNFRRFAR